MNSLQPVAVCLLGCLIACGPLPSSQAQLRSPERPVSSEVQAAHCFDGAFEPGAPFLETGPDCGGPDCAPCGAGNKCNSGADCASGVCTPGAPAQGYCRAPTFTDGVKNGQETDVDCGGAANAPVCALGKSCFTDGDCASLSCVGGICSAPSCTDSVKNGSETGTDCGGSCGPCLSGSRCAVAADCVSGFCSAGYCRQPNSCANGRLDSGETGVDCGGPCRPCGAGVACLLNRDCSSGVCAGNQCAAATCGDGVRNGSESGVDCGGPGCEPCNVGGQCLQQSDCASPLSCLRGFCAPGLPTLAVQVGARTSSAVTLTWAALSGGSAIRVYLGAEPPAIAGARLPDARLVATLAGSATSATVSDLAPAVDGFFRVEADLAQGITLSANLSVRTLGGPRAVLATAAREVHALSPRVLQLVLAGGDGPTWQAGPWTLGRSSGPALHVTQVFRQSLPISAPDYAIGWGAASDDAVLVDHRIALVLDGPLASPEVLDLNGPGGLHLVLPFSDRYLETPAVQLNQVGYNPRATRRYAYVSGFLGDGGALDLSGYPAAVELLDNSFGPIVPRAAVLTGLALTTRAALDPDAGGEVREIDLSALAATEGKSYRIRVPGVGVSWPTQVSEAAALKSFYTVTRGLLHNRWAGDLNARVTDFTRPQDHGLVYIADNLSSGYFPIGQSTAVRRTLFGGYHDAGNFTQKPSHTAVAQLLLRAYELNPTHFTDGQLDLPESGDGLPDLLDEALWGVAGWEALQDSTGGVRSGIQSTRQVWGVYPASSDPLLYWTYQADANTSARVAGLFAQAARLLAPLGPARAARLSSEAIAAYGYAAANGARPSPMLQAAGELFRLTGQGAYKQDFESAWSAVGTYGAFSGFAPNQLSNSDYSSNARSPTDGLLGYLMSPGASATILATAHLWLGSYAQSAVNTLNAAHAHRNPRPASYSMDWGQGTSTSRFLDTAVGLMQLGGLDAATQQAYFDALSLSADYLLGGNPNGLVYVTGLGSRSAEEPLHLDSLVWIKTLGLPAPGIPVFGPASSLDHVGYLATTQAAFYPAFNALPPGLRFADVRLSPQTAEFTVWESQAPEAELFAILLGSGQSAPASWRPGGAQFTSPLP